jgi:ribosomal protein L32/vacuolar-type H+-ATPase subunit I/STV1
VKVECPNCHRQTVRGKFCIFCGYSLESPQPPPRATPVEEVTQQEVECPNCHRQTVKLRFCIYCGYALEAVRSPPRTVSVGEAVQQEPVPETEAPKPLEAGPQQAVETAMLPEPESEAVEVRETAPMVVAEKDLMEQLSSLYTWFFRLVDLFLEGEADPEAFSELVGEYGARIKEVGGRLDAKVLEAEERVASLNAELNSLRVRREAGEITDKQYGLRKIEIEKGFEELGRRLTYLRNPFGIRLASLPSFKAQVEERLRRVEEEGGRLGLSEEAIGQVREVSNRVLDAISFLEEQHRRVMREISKLEIRRKTGEISQSEYQSLKQRLERRLESGGL